MTQTLHPDAERVLHKIEELKAYDWLVSGREQTLSAISRALWEAEQKGRAEVETFLERAAHGNIIVSTAMLSPDTVVIARAQDRMFVAASGLGYVAIENRIDELEAVLECAERRWVMIIRKGGPVPMPRASL